MRISRIQPQIHNNTNFKGYVNNKYYADRIIVAAKAALENPDWESQMRAKKSTFLKDYLTAHDDAIEARIMAGIVSFGTTELVTAAFCALGAAADDTEEDINEIKNCMIDLLKSK